MNETLERKYTAAAYGFYRCCTEKDRAYYGGLMMELRPQLCRAGYSLDDINALETKGRYLADKKLRSGS